MHAYMDSPLRPPKSRLERDPALCQEWRDAWDRNADWFKHRVRLGCYSLAARVSPQANPKEILGALGFEVIEAKTRPLQKSSVDRSRRALPTAAALGGRKGLVHSVRCQAHRTSVHHRSRRASMHAWMDERRTVTAGHTSRRRRVDPLLKRQVGHLLGHYRTNQRPLGCPAKNQEKCKRTIS